MAIPPKAQIINLDGIDADYLMKDGYSVDEVNIRAQPASFADISSVLVTPLPDSYNNFTVLDDGVGFLDKLPERLVPDPTESIEDRSVVITNDSMLFEVDVRLPRFSLQTLFRIVSGVVTVDSNRIVHELGPVHGISVIVAVKLYPKLVVPGQPPILSKNNPIFVINMTSISFESAHIIPTSYDDPLRVTTEDGNPSHSHVVPADTSTPSWAPWYKTYYFSIGDTFEILAEFDGLSRYIGLALEARLDMQVSFVDPPVGLIVLADTFSMGGQWHADFRELSSPSGI